MQLTENFKDGGIILIEEGSEYGYEFDISFTSKEQAETIDMYKHWNTVKLNEERFEILKKSMPAKYIPEGMMTQQLGVEEMKVNTMWNAYNSITERIWHNDKTDYATKKITFDRLHQVMLKVGR